MPIITICGSIAFFKEMQDIKNQLESLGHTVKIPPAQVKDKDANLIQVSEYYQIRKAAESNKDNTDWIWRLKTDAMKAHFDKIALSDSILVLNLDKNGIKGYVGSKTFLEAGLALHLNKNIYFLNPVPEQQCKEEILGMHPLVINGDLSIIK
jgi:diphthamide synthase subunit DPH2